MTTDWHERAILAIDQLQAQVERHAKNSRSALDQEKILRNRISESEYQNAELKLEAEKAKAVSPIPVSLPEQMRWAAPILAAACKRSEEERGYPEVYGWNEKGLLLAADRWQAEDREKSEQLHLLEEVGTVLFGPDWDGRPSAEWARARDRLQEFLKTHTVVRKAAGE